MCYTGPLILTLLYYYSECGASFEYRLFAWQDLRWEPDSGRAPLLVAVVPALPRGAAVELHVAAVQDDFTQRTSRHLSTKVACGSVECRVVTSADRCCASVSLSLVAAAADLEAGAAPEVAGAVSAAFRSALEEEADAGLVPLCARVFHKCSSSAAREIVKGGFHDSSVNIHAN